MVVELKPKYCSQVSFWKRAKVEITECPDYMCYVLCSYDTIIATVYKYSNNDVQLNLCKDSWVYSKTTMKHLRDFIYQYFDVDLPRKSKRDLLSQRRYDISANIFYRYA